MTVSDVADFAREHQKAMLLLLAASNDYSAARCLLLNGLFSGLPLGAQAVEKLLKATILFADPAKAVDRTHNLPLLLARAESLSPSLKPLSLGAITSEFFGYYQMRYPENPNRSPSVSTGCFRDLDTMIIGLNVNLPCPRNVKMRSGIFSEVTSSLDPSCDVSRIERWIKQDNLALAPHWTIIEHGYFETMREAYPANPELHHR